MISEIATKSVESAGMRNILENLGQKIEAPSPDMNAQMLQIEHISENAEISRMSHQLEDLGREMENTVKNLDEICEQPRTSWDDCATKPIEGGKTLYETVSGRDSALLNGELPKNSQIRVAAADGSESYAIVDIDSIERQEEFFAHIEPTTKEGVRDLHQQTRCRDLKDGLATDDAGHLWARETGGPSEQINLCPMDAYTNRHGEWRLVERNIKKHLDCGKAVDLHVIPEYTGPCKRPDGFNVKITVDGQTTEYYISNSPTKQA